MSEKNAVTTKTTGKVTVREAVIDLLRQWNIKTIFGNPGSTELPMFRDFPEDFRYVLALQESVAVAMADGFAQSTQNASIVNLHSASGVGHGLGNIFTAFKNRTPIVIIAGQQSRSILPFDPFLFAQDAAQFPQPYVKYSVEPARAEDVPAAIARAYYMAMQPPCGPTFVSVPVDDWDVLTDPIATRTIFASRRPDATALSKVAEALAAAERPAFVFGAEADQDNAYELGVEFAERHNASVYGAPQSCRASFPENHPLFAGFLPARRDRIVQMLDKHDLVLVFGSQVFPYHIEGDGPFIPQHTTLFQFTEDAAWASSAAAGDSILCTMRAAIADLLKLPARSRPAPKGRSAPEPVPVTTAISEALVMDLLAKLRPDNSIVVNEAPSAGPFRQKHLQNVSPRSFFVTASGGLGYGLPAAVGIALGERDRKVMALLGDGSSMYGIQGLYSAAQLGLPITFIVLNNRRYEALQDFATHFGLPRDIVGTELIGLDFVALAKGHGCDAVRVEDGERLEEVLKDALRSPRPIVVEIVLQ